MSTTTSAAQAERWHAVIFRIRGLLRRYWWILISTTIVGLGVAAILASREETWFQSSARMVVSGRVHVTEGNAYSEEGSNFFGTQIELMKSPQVRIQTEARVKAQGRVAPSPVSSLEIGVVPGASIFQLRVTAKTADYSQAYLDALLDEYIALKRSMRNEKTVNAIAGLTDEMLRLEKEWKAAEEEGIKFQQEHSLVFLREGENNAAKYLAGLDLRQAELSTQLRLLDQLDLDQLRGLQPPKAAPEDAAPDGKAKEVETPSYIAQTDYLKTRQTLRGLERKRIELAANLREEHPDLIALDKDIAAQKQLLVVYREQSQEDVEQMRKSLASQITAVESEVDRWKKKALEVGALIAEHAKIQAKVERSKGIYDKLLTNMGNVGLTKNLEQDVVSILEHPSAPVSVRPGFQRNLMSGAVTGFLIGLIVLFLIDRSRAQIASPEEFVASFSERILGIVPEDTKAGERLRISDDRHAFAESFYNIRSSLFFLPYDGPMPKTLLLTSAVPNEGKSTLSLNIALAFAFAGSRTLLIDGDLRRGALHVPLNVPNNRGFTEVLQRSVKWRDVVVETEVANLSLITRGGNIAQPSKYLLHSSTDALLRELHEEYDQIIIDSCPVLAADDTTSLAPKVEAVMVIVRIGTVTHRQISAALGALSSRQANVLGVVLNGIDSRSPSFGYYSYADYYSKETPAVQGT